MILLNKRDYILLKVGLLGAGRIARVHASAISRHPKSDLVAISDYYPEHAEKLSSEYGGAVATTEGIIADDGIDAVLIATPTDTHSDLIESASASGKAILCEKPIDLNLDRARLCRDSVASSEHPIMIGFNRRFDTNFSLLKSSLDSGEIGKVELLSIHSYDPSPPPLDYIEVSGGIFRDMTIHDFDMANFLMGDSPILINSIGSCLVDSAIGDLGDYDTAVTTLTYADGRICVIHNSRRASYGYDQRIEVLGSDGLLQASNVLEDTLVKSLSIGIVSSPPKHFFLERYASAFSAQWAAFIESIESNISVPVSISDGIRALEMAEAATKSANTKKSVALDIR